jgi:hypothetical protein
MMFIDPNGNYPRYIGDLLIENPGWSAEKPLPLKWIMVEKTPEPLVTEGCRAVESYPENVDGVYRQTWEVVEIPNSYLQALRENLSKINSRLA